MIIANIKGGLGNQMFQYAFGRSMALRNRDTLKLDISGYNHVSTNKYSVRQFDLQPFSIDAEIATVEEVRRLKYPLGQLSRYIRGARARLFKAENVRFDSRMCRKKGDMYLDGYWQSELYFAEYGEIIRNDFTPREPFGAKAQSVLGQIQNSNVPVSIHIRRGDNAYNTDSMRRFGMPALSYYQQAPSEIAGRIASNDITLYVFSDDIEWVKENLVLPFPTCYVSGSGIADWEEVVLMSKCAHHVIANSTFSWWGAWLNPNSEKIVVAPLHWAKLNPEAFKDIIPPAWIRI